MNQGFFYNFLLLIEGSGPRRPKNIWIRRIRIRNTEENYAALGGSGTGKPINQLFLET
jgi:hypothetical protein